MNGTDDSDIDYKKMSSRELIARWLFSQGASTVLLTAIMAALAYGGNYWMTVAMPSQVLVIQAGYDRSEAEHTRQWEKLAAMCEKTLDRLESHPKVDNRADGSDKKLN